jgi:hypothetical protein
VLYDEASAPPEDPCAYESPDKFTLSFHIGGVFAVLFASAIGAALPLFASLGPKNATTQFVIIIGKCVGTGIILACGLIHMLLVSGRQTSIFFRAFTPRLLRRVAAVH